MIERGGEQRGAGLSPPPDAGYPVRGVTPIRLPQNTPGIDLCRGIRPDYGKSIEMMLTTRGKICAGVITAVMLSGGAVAAASPAPVQAPPKAGMTCDALTSTKVPVVETLLTTAGITAPTDPTLVGLNCTEQKGGSAESTAVSITGVEKPGFSCGKVDEPIQKVVFLSDCE